MEMCHPRISGCCLTMQTLHALKTSHSLAVHCGSLSLSHIFCLPLLHICTVGSSVPSNETCCMRNSKHRCPHLSRMILSAPWRGWQLIQPFCTVDGVDMGALQRWREDLEKAEA
ncbi:hypothetical protein KP509_01G042800 [Ceratopteris richardii]|uniref:Uncharacterized protein n=1 Tax=Ceratopteris richardii TaxID=49495 RepID=A0A8T2VGC9_CERRI|nr:hypothetical protein KP509_01G042800 [Ceratopteris richardii]